MIDSLIEKYKNKIKYCDEQIYEYKRETDEELQIKLWETSKEDYQEILKDLKRLKNEIHYIDTSKLETDGINHKVIIKTAELIKADFKQKETGKKEAVTISKIDLLRTIIKFIKLNQEE